MRKFIYKLFEDKRITFDVALELLDKLDTNGNR